ncbi:hypothetical protein CHL78_001235 [Romboutsia weinsteinii]|uniref:Lipoprotein n=1 Tax=Romboutsia weinsteinii TaxID=2020949 RepID=A0A371J9B6_9FIRM|nr:glycoside hydrolase [Romboutsia weinsteinii]RDY29351.1 hypothetical protein CHL78_001235 [Romboutsia weinsteinii]
MKKKISVLTSCILTSCILIGTTLVGCTNQGTTLKNEIKQEVNNLDFGFEVDPNTFEVSVEVDGKTEKISDPLQEREVSKLEKSKDEISWTYPKENIDVSITKENDYLDVDIKSNSKEETKFSWPKISGESYVLPIHEGKYIPSNDKYFKEYLDGQVYNVIESFSMQFFSVNKDNFAVSYIIKNKFNNEIEFDTKNNINFTFDHEFPSINKNKEYGFRIYLTDKNIVDMAKTYKNYIVEKGEFKTLEEKAKDNKNIEKLYGAPHIYFWDKSIITKEDIKWNLLKDNMSQDLEDWIKQLLKTKVEDGEESIAVFDQIKSQDYVDNYQKTQIIRALNSVMLLEEFYNADVFKNTDDVINKEVKKGIDKLSKIELINLNKKLLKSELKNATTKVDDWAKYNTVDVLDEMKSSGLENAWIGFDDIESGYVSPELVEKANKYGYLVGPYDSYHSIHKPGEEKWSTAKFEDKSLYENATVENKEGKKLEGFQGEGRKLNPILSLPSVKTRVSDIMNDGYAFNSWFIDCDATGEIYDDYSKEHTTTQEEDLKARLDRMDYIRDKEKMVIGSEGGNDFASTTISFAHGLETPAFSWVDQDMSKNKESKYYVGRYYSATGGVPEVFSKQIPVKELYKKIFIDPEYSVPLFKLVYNDSVVSSYHWLWGTFKIEDEVKNRMMKEVLYNTPPMYHIDRTEWDKHKDDIVSHNKVWTKFNKKVIKEEMTDFKYLTDNRLVQLTRFGSDVKVIANFSDSSFDYEGDTIKAGTLVIYDKNEKTVY